MKLVYFQDKNGGWRWHVLARNNRIVAESGEAYTRRADARRTWVKLRAAILDNTLESQADERD